MSLPPEQPCHRAIVAVDITGSTTRTNTAKILLRRDIYDLFEQALRTTGIADHHRDSLIDRGDGILALIYPVDQVPKTLLVHMASSVLNTLLMEHASANPARQLQLRVVVHAGEVHYDQRGCFGEALDVSFRLLDAPKVRKQLHETTARLILVVSDIIYQSVVRHDYYGIDRKAFKPLVNVQVGHERHRGWTYIPDEASLHATAPTNVHPLISKPLHALSQHLQA